MKRNKIFALVGLLVIVLLVLSLGGGFKKLKDMLGASSLSSLLGSNDSTVLSYTKYYYDSTGAVYDSEEIPISEKEIKENKVFSSDRINAIPVSEGEIVEIYNDPNKPQADADGVIVTFKKDSVLEARAKAVKQGKKKADVDLIAKNQGLAIASEHASAKAKISKALGKELIKGNKKENGKINISEFQNSVNAIVLKGVSVKDTKKKLKSISEVEKIEPNTLVKATLTESVPQINADQVWPYTDLFGQSLDGSGITVGVIDTGVDYTHPDLGGCLGSGCKVVGGYDFINGDADPMDDHGHGTHVAATVAGVGTYIPTGETVPVPILGVAPNATLYAYKVLSSEGSGNSGGIIAAMEKCADPNGDGFFDDHLDVCTLSLGGSGNPDDAQSIAADNVTDLGVVFTIAAGNSGPASNSVISPGTSRKAITVAAAHKPSNGVGITSFSSRGPVDWSGTSGALSIDKPDIAAPGSKICAAQWGTWHSQDTCGSGNHIAISGTSMATPHMAGVVALLLQAHPDYTPQQIKDLVKQTATPFAGFDIYDQGSGLVNSVNALFASGLPQAVYGVSGDLPLIINDNVSQTIQTFTKNVSIKNIQTQTITVNGTLTFNNPAVTATISPSNFTLTPGQTQNITLTITVNHNTLETPNITNGVLNLTSSAGDLSLGVTVYSGSRVQYTPSSIDFGADPVLLNSWQAPTKQIVINNNLLNQTQTYSVTVGFDTSSVNNASDFVLDKTTVVLSPGGTEIVNIDLSIDNLALAGIKGTFNGNILLSSPLESINIPIVVRIGYVAEVFFDAGVENIRFGTLDYQPAAGVTSTKFFSHLPGPWKVNAWYSDSTGTFGSFVYDEDLMLNQVPVIAVNLNESYADNTIDLDLTRPDGTTPSGTTRPLFYIGEAFFTGDQMSFDKLKFRINDVADTRYSVVVEEKYNYSPIVYTYMGGPSITSSQILANTANDFAVKKIIGFHDSSSNQMRLDIRYTLGSWHITTQGGLLAGQNRGTPFNLYAYTNGGPGPEEVDHLELQDTANCNWPVGNIPSFQLVTKDSVYGFSRFVSPYYHIKSNKTYAFSEYFNFETKYPCVSGTYNDFKVDQAPSDIIYVGLKPFYPFVKNANYKRNFWSFVRSTPLSFPSTPFHTNDSSDRGYSLDVVPVTYTLKKGTQVIESGLWEGYEEQGENYIPVTQDGNYTFELEKNEPINGVNTNMKLTQNFKLQDSPVIDQNPPMIKEMHIVANNIWQSVVDESKTNTFVVKIDPVVGLNNLAISGSIYQRVYDRMPSDSLTSVSLKGSTDGGVTWSTIPIAPHGDAYEATLPIALGTNLYSYEITAVDTAGNSTAYKFQVPSGLSLDINNLPVDTTPPVITIIGSNVTNTTAGIEWETDEPATSQVSYGIAQNYMTTQSLENTSLDLNHTVTLSGLNAGTRYYYKPKSVDSSGNIANYIATNGQYPAFVTSGTDVTPPTFIDVNVTNITQSGATISWNNMENTTTPSILYGLTSSYGSTGFVPNMSSSIHTGTLNNLAPGTYHFAVKAKDSNGNFGTSSDFTFTTLGSGGDTTNPTVSITAPTNGTSITSGPVSITATATDNVAVSSVQFKIDGVALGAPDASAPYTASWSLTGVTNGTHTITATATDAAGNVANSSITVTVAIADTTPPTTPTGLIVTRSGNNAALIWGGSSDASGIAGYYVYRDGSTTALNTTAITGLGYTDTPTPNTAHTYIVKAKDNAGNFSNASNQVSINIDTAGPITNINAPTSGSTLSGTITMSVTASDPSMIDHIVFYRGVTQICDIPGNNQTSGTFTCSWNTASVANGSYSITAIAYDKVTPGANATTTSANSVTVSNVVIPPADTTAPSTPTNLTATATSTSQINLSWTASTDNVGVTGYKIYRCTGAGCTPTTQIGSSTTTTYSNTGLTAGTVYVYRVTANDAAGNNSGYSTSATATTSSGGLPDVIVTGISFSVAYPAVGENVVFGATVKNQGTASTPTVDNPNTPKNEMLTGVQFLINGVSYACADGYTTPIAPGASVTMTMGTGTLCAASNTSWNANAGVHTITAIVDDIDRFVESNETNNSATQTITVTSDTVAPTVSIQTPANGISITGGTTQTITATASDASGIQNVKFYVDGTQYGTTDVSAPYEVVWNTTGFIAGNHTITAVATDNAGNSTTSSVVNVTIQIATFDTTPPTVAITSHTNLQDVPNGVPITFVASATDNIGVTEVKFFRGSQNTNPVCTLVSPTISPSSYSCNIIIKSKNLGLGYTFVTVQAKDAAGNIKVTNIKVR